MKTRRKMFYLHDKLHRIVRVIRQLDIVECWSFEDQQLVAYPWSMTKKQMQKAYTTREVAELVNRHMVYVRTLVHQKKIRGPAKAYGLRHYFNDEPTPYAKSTWGNPERIPRGWYWWSDKHILELHDFMLSSHFGRPRNDGRVMPKKDFPSRKELLAKLRNETVLYVKNEDGDFDPVWKETDFGK